MIQKESFRTAPSNASEISTYLRTIFEDAGVNETFGQAVMDAYFVKIDEMLTQGFEQNMSTVMSDHIRLASGGSETEQSTFELERGIAEARSVHKRQASSECETTQGTFDLEGVKYTGSFTLCPKETQDKMKLDFSFSTDLTGTRDEKAGKSFTFELVVQASIDKCPSVEGKVSGESLTHLMMDVKVDNKSAYLLCDSQFNIDAAINNEAEVELVDVNLNVGAEGYDSEYPLTGYGAVSHVTHPNFELANNAFRDKLIGGLTPQGPCPNPKGISLGIALGVVASQATAEKAKENWQRDGTCVEIQLDPENLEMSSGETKSFDARLTYVKDGSEVQAKLTAGTSNGKTITPQNAEFIPGTPVTFEYTSPDEGTSGDYSIIATSKCGKDTIEKIVSYDFYVVIDSTLTFENSSLKEIGHIRSEIPIAYSKELGRLAGIGPGNYLDFQFISSGDCSFETIYKSCSDLKIIDFKMNSEQPSASSVVLTPFTTSEQILAHCPEGSASGPPVDMYFANFFYTIHFDEFLQVEGGKAFVFSDWTISSEPGIPLIKRYDRFISEYNITENTIIELHTVME